MNKLHKPDHKPVHPVHSQKCRKPLRGNGGRTRARTWDPMIKSHLLYQLSYAPGTRPGKPSQEGVV
jgi:hypothetical protein